MSQGREGGQKNQSIYRPVFGSMWTCPHLRSMRTGFVLSLSSSSAEPIIHHHHHHHWHRHSTIISTRLFCPFSYFFPLVNNIIASSFHWSGVMRGLERARKRGKHHIQRAPSFPYLFFPSRLFLRLLTIRHPKCLLHCCFHPYP